MPANPHHASTRNASLLVRAYHHSTALNVPIRGVAEGIVDGRRVSLPLTLEATHQTGVFALVTPLPKGGTWVLALTLTQSENAIATALVTVDHGGRIVAVDVPSDNSRDGWKVPRRVQQRDIEDALRAAHVAPGGGAAGSRAFQPALCSAAGPALRRDRGVGTAHAQNVDIAAVLSIVTVHGLNARASGIGIGTLRVAAARGQDRAEQHVESEGAGWSCHGQ